MVARAIQTRITSLFNCRYPIILPGMSWISTPELVAAVSNAGGLGILATGPLNSRETRAAIKRIRELTDEPFGIGATLLMPGAPENASVAIGEEVPVVNVSLGKADWIAEGVHSYGGKVLSTVTNANHARRAISSGADALMVTGHEAAAHGGDVTSLVLVATMSQQFPDVPIVAAGGFADGRGLAAALALGADAVAMGTRFAVTADSPLPPPMKEIITKSRETDTIYGKHFDGIPARVLKTPLSEKLMSRPPSIFTILWRAFHAARDFNVPLWKVVPGMVLQWDKMYAAAQFGAATKTLKAATIHGRVNEGVQFVGQGQGMIHDIPSVEELVQQMMHEAKAVSDKNAEIFWGEEEEEEELEAIQKRGEFWGDRRKRARSYV